MEGCFKRRSSDATKIRRFFYLCKYFHSVLIISHLSVPLIFNVKSKNNEGVRKGYPLFLCKSPNFPKLGLFNLL